MKRILGITYEPTRQFPQGEKQFVLAKAAGIDAVQLPFLTQEPIAEQAALCRACGMQVETVHLPYHDINAVWVKDPAGDDFIDLLTDRLQVARAAHIPLAVLHTCSGENPPSVSQLGLNRFRTLAERAEKLGVRLAIENTRHVDQFDTVVRTCCTGYHGVCWDCGHEALHTPDYHVGEIFGKQLLTVHLHDNQTAAFDSTQEDQHRIPFDGKVDFERVAAALATCRYRGVILGELHPYDPMYAQMSYEAFVSRAYEALHRIARMCDDKEGVL